MVKSTCIALAIMVISIGSLHAAQYECPSSWLGNFQGNRGAKNWEKGNLDVAEKQTRKAIEHDPECSMWHQNLGFILESKGRIDEASRSWHKSMEVDRYWCNGYKTGSLIKLGEYYLFQVKDYGKSISNFEVALSMVKAEEVDGRTRSRIYLYLSYNYTEPNTPFYDLNKAMELKDKALAYDPGNLFIEASIASVLVKQGKFEEAKTKIAEILRDQEKSSNPNPGVYGYLAFVYSQMNDPEKAAHFIEMAMDMHPSQAEYLLSELDGDFKKVATSNVMKPMIEKAKVIQGSK